MVCALGNSRTAAATSSEGRRKPTFEESCLRDNEAQVIFRRLAEKATARQDHAGKDDTSLQLALSKMCSVCPDSTPNQLRAASGWDARQQVIPQHEAAMAAFAKN